MFGRFAVQGATLRGVEAVPVDVEVVVGSGMPAFCIVGMPDAAVQEARERVRAAAKKFGVSKSTVHKDLQDRLPQFNRSLYLQVKEVLEVNKAQRHIRGGMATRKKYKGF